MTTKHALLVGIDHYPGFPLSNQLSSCVGDAQQMAGVLRERFGFTDAGIRMLLDEQATRQGILDALEGLASDVGEGDVVVFFYSGHGSRMRDPDGDEPDGWDETLVPHDSGRGEHPNRDIRDDELYDWILRVNRTTPFVTVILDSCKAGSAVRGTVREKWVFPDPRPASRQGSRPTLRDATPGGPPWTRGPSGWLPISDRFTLLAACHGTETAKEHPVPDVRDLKHGAFTWFLIQELRRLAPGSTYRDLMEVVGLQVNGTYPTQTPQVEGARDRSVFGVEHLEPQRFIPVSGLEGSKVLLAGGAAHGLTEGSEWSIHPAGTRRANGTGLGRVEVRTVRAVTADAEIVRGNSSAGVEEAGIIAGCRAFEFGHREDLCMPVDVRVEALAGEQGERLARLAEALGTRIGASKLLRQAAEGETARAVVQALAPRAERPDDDLFAAERADHPVWALVGADGSCLRTPYPVFEPGSVQRVTDNLETLARFLRLLHLEDGAPDNPLHGQLELRLLRRGAGGDWVTAEPQNGETLPVYREGEPIAFELIHHCEHPVYLHVFDLGLTCGICLLHPVAGEAETQEPGRPLRIGVREGDELTVGLPDELAGNGGIERIKVFATTHETDLTWLVQKRFRVGGANRLERRLGAIFCGGQYRSDGPDPKPGYDNEHWTALTAGFRVRR